MGGFQQVVGHPTDQGARHVDDAQQLSGAGGAAVQGPARRGFQCGARVDGQRMEPYACGVDERREAGVGDEGDVVPGLRQALAESGVGSHVAP